MEHDKKIISLLEESMSLFERITNLLMDSKINKQLFESSFLNFSDIPPKYIAEAIYDFHINTLEPIVEKVKLLEEEKKALLEQRAS